MKSDTATIASRRNRLLELLSEGMSETQAAEILRSEGYPASHDTVERDVDALAPAWRAENASAYEHYRKNQFTRITAKWAEIENDASMSGAEKHAAWARWMKLEMDLLGTAAPTRSHSTSLNVNADVTTPLAFDFYDRQCFEWKGVPRDRWEEAFLAVRAALQPFKAAQKHIKDEVTEICQRFLPPASENTEKPE